MQIVSRRTVAEDPEIPTKPGWDRDSCECLRS